jgi:hypothetical protein
MASQFDVVEASIAAEVDFDSGGGTARLRFGDRMVALPAADVWT